MRNFLYSSRAVLILYPHWWCETSFVKFHVYDSETRKPVPGVKIWLFSVGTAYTDETGTCEMWSWYVVPFKDTLLVSKDGYKTIYEYGYTVNYENTLYLVPVSPPPPPPPPPPKQYRLSVYVSNPLMGTVDGKYPPGEYVLAEGTAVTATATARPGCRFDYWLLDGASRRENPITFSMDRDYRLTAYFSGVVAPPPVWPPVVLGPLAFGLVVVAASERRW